MANTTLIELTLISLVKYTIIKMSSIIGRKHSRISIVSVLFTRNTTRLAHLLRITQPFLALGRWEQLYTTLTMVEGKVSSFLALLGRSSTA